MIKTGRGKEIYIHVIPVKNGREYDIDNSNLCLKTEN